MANGNPRRLLSWLVPVIGALLVGVVVISPLALDYFDGLDTEWERRSTIGQTYGAISALLAALALGGVAVSVFLQRQESLANREFALRTIHGDLMRMAIEDPDLAACLESTVSRQHVYCNLLFSYWESRYVLGVLPHAEVNALAADLLGTQPGYRYWTKARSHRFAHHRSRKELSFRRAFDEEYGRLFVQTHDGEEMTDGELP